MSKKFIEYLQDNRRERNLRLFFDIETLQYNEEQGKIKPSKYKNVTYSVAVGYFKNEELEILVLPSFKDFFNLVIEAFKPWKRKPRIELIAHNTNKYDNHFMYHDLIYFYGLKTKNLYLRNATKDGNIMSFKKGQLTKDDKNGVIFEKRIKSSNNLELDFYIDNINFYTTDNFVKTHTSINVLGKKLLNLNLITDDELKTDYNYTKYNKPYDMDNETAYLYAKKVFNQLNHHELTYIKNDIIILAKSVMYYDKIFQGFDYSKITFTTNILDYYNDNDLTSYQLLKSIGYGKEKVHVKYTDYLIGKQNFYDYLKSFYGGGLNLYNSKYIGNIVKSGVFSMDINSSYPYVMHIKKVPTFLKDFKEYEAPEKIDIKPFSDDEFFMYRMTKYDFDNQVISRIKSKVFRQMLVKYYNKYDYININTYTLKMIEAVAGVRIKELNVLSYVCFECLYFGSAEKIAEKYRIKEQGASEKKILFNNPYDIKVTDEKNDLHFTKGEIDIAKTILNGLYGIPALRSHFNIFRRIGLDLENIKNGYENNERNIVFSVFVTSVSLYNLLLPLKDLTPSEIDNNFLYCDTDSLYLKKDIENKIDNKLFNNHHLGYWAKDETNISHFIVINHKKYAYQVDNKITVKAGGIPNNSFNRNMTFDGFVKTQFSHGVKIETQKAIFNEQGTISIYPSTTELQHGHGYQLFCDDDFIDGLKDKMIKEIQEKNVVDDADDLLYIESNLGTFSMSEIYPHKHETEIKQDLSYLLITENEIKNRYF